MKNEHTFHLDLSNGWTPYQPDWASEGERLGYVERHYRMRDDVVIGDVTYVYLIRDVWIIVDEENERVRFKTCEYAVKNEAGSSVWTRCNEGVSFADIEPFEKAA